MTKPESIAAALHASADQIEEGAHTLPPDREGQVLASLLEIRRQIDAATQGKQYDEQEIAGIKNALALQNQRIQGKNLN